MNSNPGRRLVQFSLEGRIIELETMPQSAQAEYIRRHGVYERHLTLFFAWFLPKVPNLVFFDVGANVGYYSLLASYFGGEKGKVISFEPAVATREVLQSNIKRNKLSNITVDNRIVCADDISLEFVALPDASEESYATVSQRHKSSESQISIDRYCEENSIYPSIIKCDAEGFDLDVIKGSLNTLRRGRTAVVFEFQPSKIHAVSPTKPSDIFEHLQSIEYTPYMFRGHSTFSVEALDFDILHRIYQRWVDDNNAAHLDVLLWPPKAPRMIKHYKLPEQTA